MGLWVQNVGVNAPSIPPCVAVLADRERYWLPEPPPEGWTWASLEEMRSLAGLDRLTAQAASEAGAAAIAFSVHDEDSIYVVGAGAAGVEFRLILGADTFEAQDLGAELEHDPGPEDAEAFVAWSTRAAPAEVPLSVVLRAVDTADVHLLLEAAGLYPEQEPSAEPDWAHWYPDEMQSAGPREWTGGGRANFIGPREYAILHEPAPPYVGPPGLWILYAGERTEPFRGRHVFTFLTFVEVDTVYGLQGTCATLEDAKHRFRGSYYGRTVGDWRPIPEDVGVNSAETVAWLLAQAESHG